MAAPDYTHFLALSVADLARDLWYCGICGDYRGDESLIQSHCRQTCQVEDNDLERCVHYFNAEELATLVINLKRRADEEASRFALHMESLIGVPDFMLECRGWEA